MPLLLAMCTLFCLCSCGGSDDASQSESSEASKSEASQTVSTEESKEELVAAASFKVTVVDESGNPVSGVMIQVCKDTCIPAKTGDDGVATFNVEITDGYKLSVLSCPEGYSYNGEAEIYLDSGITEYTVEINGGAS